MTEKARRITERWLNDWVIGLNLCPFARYPYEKGQVRVSVTEAQDSDSIFRFVLEELDRLYRSEPEIIETTVLVVEKGLRDFDEYLDMLGLLEEILPQTGLEGVIQLASFHPDYCFEGVEADDVSNFTNRSPFPLIHLIREVSLEKAVASHPDPARIPERNIALMQEMGRQKVREMLASIRAAAD